jgi:DNA mismatch endonuclease (patch repair protein)
MPNTKGKLLRFEAANGFITTKERSHAMSRIKGKNTKPEIQFRKSLWAAGIRYRINNTKLPGKPDITILKYKIAIFIDGEFWHGHNWEAKKLKIKTNRDFWIPKIERNMERDLKNNKLLTNMGFQVFRFWGKEIEKNLGQCTKLIIDAIHSIKFNGIDL